jgi:hypothetical protein
MDIAAAVYLGSSPKEKQILSRPTLARFRPVIQIGLACVRAEVAALIFSMGHAKLLRWAVHKVASDMV